MAVHQGSNPLRVSFVLAIVASMLQRVAATQHYAPMSQRVKVRYAAEMMDTPGVRRIKKYPNRRLYDTEQSRYVTLEELAALVRGGARVQVVDAKEGKDLTRQVLTQVILEEQDRLDVLPVELLHLVIQVTGTSYAQGLQSLLSRTFEPFSGAASAWSATPPDDVVAGANRLAEAWMQSMRGIFAAADAGASKPAEATPEPAPAEEAPPPPETTAPAPEMDALRDRMASLLDRLKE